LPLLLFSISIGIIDSVYWTIGGLFAEELFASQDKVWLPIVMYSAPFIFGGIIMAKLNLKIRKKFISQLLLILAALVLLFFFYPYLEANYAMLIILISSFFLALAEPLNDASYSNLLQRLGKNMEHLVGIKKVSYSIAYLIGPILAGYLSSLIGFRHAIGVVGLLILLIALFLLIATPKKIRIPQQELAKIK
jgi:predicted MFS family arabinose efflux permease